MTHKSNFERRAVLFEQQWKAFIKDKSDSKLKNLQVQLEFLQKHFEEVSEKGLELAKSEDDETREYGKKELEEITEKLREVLKTYNEATSTTGDFSRGTKVRSDKDDQIEKSFEESRRTFKEKSVFFEKQMTIYIDDICRVKFNKLCYYYERVYATHLEMLKEGDSLSKIEDREMRKDGEKEMDKANVKFRDIQDRFDNEEERRKNLHKFTELQDNFVGRAKCSANRFHE